MARTGRSRAQRWAQAALGVVLTGPVLVFVAAAGTRAGLWDWRVGYSQLTMQGAAALAALGLVAALAAVLAATQDRRARLTALLAVLIAGTTAALFGMHIRATDSLAWRGRTDTPPFQATTDAGDPPAFSGALADEREAAQAQPATRVGFQPCQVAAVAAQTAPRAAAYALEQAGFDVLGFGVGRADGTRTGFWFGFAYDATIRIRPGRTDVRVAAREARPDGGEACRLTQAIARALQPAA